MESPVVELGRGAYSVTEACRILRPSMTRRKVHHWLHTGLLGEPLRSERRGFPTLLTFEQLIKLRALQRLRDELGFSLQRVRRALSWLLDELVAQDWGELHFNRTGGGDIAVTDKWGNTYAVHTRQQVLPSVLQELGAFLAETRQAWETGVVNIVGFERIVSDAAVMGGAPVIAGTRIETAFVAHMHNAMELDELKRSFPHVKAVALREALEFEGISPAA